MKKILSLILALCMLLACTAFAENEDLTGEWYAELAGGLAVLTVNEDATYGLAFAGNLDVGPWVMEGGILYISKGTVAEMAMTYDAATGTLTTAIGEMPIVFSREMPDIFIPAEVRTDAAMEEFAGSWTATYLSFNGIVALCEEMEVSMTLYIDGPVAQMELVGLYDFPLVQTLEGAYSDVEGSRIRLIEEGDDAIPFMHDIKLLQDGMMCFEYDILGNPIYFYLEAVAEEVPAA